VLAVTCLFALQQLQVGPMPTQVGKEVFVTATDAAMPAAAVVVEVELPDGSRRPAGATAEDGRLRFTPQVAGQHVFVATHRTPPIAVGAERNRWLLGLASVPLGLALLFVHLRRVRRSKLPAAGS
jgi:hypothetical protein